MTAAILYVDDEEMLLDVGKSFLEGMDDFDVSIAHSVVEAEKLIEWRIFDAIICDYQMPERSGLDLLADLRNSGNDVPFILFTGKGREEVAIEALNSGADYYIKKGGDAKPQFAELVNAVRQAISKKEAEAAVEHNIRRFRAMFENIRDMLIEIDSDGRVSFINPFIRELLGYEEDDVIGANAFDFIAMDDVGMAQDAFKVIMDGSKANTTYYKIKAKDGREVKISTTSSRYYRNGKPYIIVSGRDVTDYVATVSALFASVKNLKAFIDQSPELILMTNEDGRINMINPQGCRLLGVDEEQAQTMDLWDFIYSYLREDHKTPERYKYYHNALIEGVKTGKSPLFGSTIEMTLHLPKGCWFYGELKFFPVKIDHGWSIVLSIRDLSIERTSGKQNLLSKKKAEVMGFVFHRELTSQLAILRQHAGFIEKSPTKPQADRSADAIRTVCKRVERVLDFQEDYESVGVENPYWHRVFQTIQRSAKKNDDIKINIDPSIANLEIFADANLEKVFDNVFENSIVHGGGVSTIWVKREESPSGTVIVIEDDGKGFEVTGENKVCRERVTNSGLGLILINEILSVTDILLTQEKATPGRGAVVKIIVPKVKVRSLL